jgi:tRNA modification GTPase
VYADPQDTVVALSSPPGPGARAVVRLTGPQAFAVATTLFESHTPTLPRRRWRYAGALRLPGVAAALPADLYAWPAPRTYTGQDLVELHTVSCPPLVEQVVAACLEAGARAALPGEFTLP